MKRRDFIQTTSAAGLFVGLGGLSSLSFQSPGKHLTILHTNDFHARFEPISKYDSGCSAEDNTEGKCFGGTARLVTAIKDALYGGVSRVHVISYKITDSLLTEVFTNGGCGTLVVLDTRAAR